MSSTEINQNHLVNGNNNNNGYSNGNTRLGSDNIPEEEIALTDQKVTYPPPCFPNENRFTDDSDTECGLGPCAPNWIQIFASKQAFLIIFCLAWIMKGVYETYFVSTITTVQKLYQIKSKAIGLVMSATEIGQIGSSLLLTYYAAHGHRPKWIACGLLLFALSTFCCSLPHFIYGAPLMNVNELPNNTEELICKLDVQNSTIYEKTCNEELVSEDLIQSSITKIVLFIFFISLSCIGVGLNPLSTLGLPYIDDNVVSKDSSLYIAIVMGTRTLGPLLGFMLGSFCIRLYVDLTVDPKIDTTDPRWAGAWWLGLVLISGFSILLSITMLTFPKRLPTKRSTYRQNENNNNKKLNLTDFYKTIKRLLKNDILWYRTASSVLHILPIAGFYTFLPKYLETQFRLSTPDANMMSGMVGILIIYLGIIISGVVIKLLNPSPKFIAGWIAITAIIYTIGMCILMFVGCSTDNLVGLQNHDDIAPLNPVCNTTICDCNKDKFAPICGHDGRTYVSACQAGCRNFTTKNGIIIEFTDCFCISNNFTNITTDEPLFKNATIGYCDVECTNFVWYSIIFLIFVFIHSTSEVGSMVLTLKCVDKKDKAMALGFIQLATGLFGDIPCPIIYGAVVDSACLVWDMSCGEQGACNFYDSNFFRLAFHGITALLFLCAFFTDIIVWRKADKITHVNEQMPSEDRQETDEQVPLEDRQEENKQIPLKNRQETHKNGHL